MADPAQSSDVHDANIKKNENKVLFLHRGSTAKMFENLSIERKDNKASTKAKVDEVEEEDAEHKIATNVTEHQNQEVLNKYEETCEESKEEVEGVEEADVLLNVENKRNRPESEAPLDEVKNEKETGTKDSGEEPVEKKAEESAEDYSYYEDDEYEEIYSDSETEDDLRPVYKQAPRHADSDWDVD